MKLLVLIMLMSIVCYELKGQTKFKAESGVGISIVDYPGPAKNTYNDAETLSYFEVKPMVKYDVGFSLEVPVYNLTYFTSGVHLVGRGSTSVNNTINSPIGKYYVELKQHVNYVELPIAIKQYVQLHKYTYISFLVGGYGEVAINGYGIKDSNPRDDQHYLKMSFNKNRPGNLGPVQRTDYGLKTALGLDYKAKYEVLVFGEYGTSSLSYFNDKIYYRRLGLMISYSLR